MELSLHVQKSLSCRGNFPPGSYVKIRPYLRFSAERWDDTSLFTPCYKLLPQMKASSFITATADYSRRRQRKSQIPRTRGPSPKGFMPKPPVGSTTQKIDRVDNVEKEESGPSTSSEYTAPVKSSKTEVKVDNEKSPRSELISKTSPSSSKAKMETKVLEEETKVLEEDVQESMEKKDQTSYERKPAILIMESEIEEKSPLAGIDQDLAEPEQPKILDEIKEDKRATMSEIEKDSLNLETSEVLDERETDEGSTVVKPDQEFVELEKTKKVEIEDVESEEKQLVDPHARWKLIENLAKESFSLGNKVFVYPQVVKPGQEIEIFLNRAISTLIDEPNILIMGAFNDWRWKSFTKPLANTDFGDDWWSCKVYVPREAYKIDFVFFNGGTGYDNNDSKDFFIPVEGGMDFFTFEDFLLDEKRRELEKLAAEEAERKRRAEEQRRIEAEKMAEEADKARSKVKVEKIRENFRKVMNKAVVSVENVWHIVPSEFKGGHLVRLYYNRQTGPLALSGELWIHGGYNSWKDGLSIVGRLVRTNKEGGDWWYANVIVPDRALVLDWVFADGPPEGARLYDNNNFQDFHAIVPDTTPEELYWVEEERQICKKLQQERRQREEALRAKAEKTARMKAETKEKTMKMFLLSQKHIVYTDPLEVQAGSNVTVFYNPSNTVLSGKPEVWFRCSFNCWTHHHGPLPPQKMMPVENGTHVKVSVKVPLDAYMMDFVFSEKEDGGIYDNKNGMDYHIPVVGRISKEPPMHIVHITVEMAPIAKVGGLGDVVTSLSRAVQDLGHNVDIILPKYDCMNLTNVKDFQFHRSYAWGGTEIKVWHGKVEGLPVYFLEPQNGLFWVGCIYGRGNDGERFGFFCHAALEFLLQSGFHPDILHCHDWSSAPVAWLFKDHYQHYGLSNARVVFTIHNLEFGAALIGKAMVQSDKATTVSPNYAREVSQNPVIASHLFKFHGIVNGIDPDIWDTFNDKFIPISYTSENVVEGKKAAKEALQQRLGLRRSDYPLVGIITRLTAQKGIHLIKHAILRTLDRNGQVVLLGSAPDPRIQNDFVNLANQLHSSHADCARLCLTYDEPLSHLIYAGADFILVPSIFEPCGLTQLIAMRYGSIPVVRKTGGLYDTVYDVDHDKERAQAVGLEPNGFSFDGADSAGVDYALDRAISAWYDGKDWFNSLCKRVMEQDWSWNRPSLDYMELYYAARK